MLTQALSMDFNSEKLKKFDGTTVYAINKRHQVIMMEELAKENPKVFFSSMHPGWADTPAVRSAMPGFYAKMKNNLRSPEEGADTAIFLAISPSALKFPSGKFFQDRLPVDVHLPLAWTKYTDDEAKEFMTKLDHLAQKFKDSSSVTVEKEAEENP
ncbi:unnamed protein product [Cyprideis torosa]|uniref:Uncharacterized protein n=1 Tax=Cyprideis torosa TaxID=163714 RepID=A0A7R8WGW8_9CRUS|nr:unnamed protein product [Cyprideis torosa]CAG0898704.1 unnamed protein product [Cyprideis torosa]